MIKNNKYLVLIASFLFTLQIHAQITSYSKWDNVESVAYEVEEMESDEIKTYNSFINNGISIEYALKLINAGRAQTNLIYAPATIINYNFSPEVTEQDSIQDALGACNIWVEIINTTPKIIREITVEFEFLDYNTQLYDIKTGGKYCVLKFNNLKGRTNSNKYVEIEETIMDCYSILGMSDASYKKLFYNKKANTIRLHKAIIKYNDGTTSNKIAVFDNDYSNSLLYDGPLKPLIDMYNRKASTNKKGSSNEILWHIVSQGETLESIAQKYNISVEKLCQLNNISPYTKITRGNQLRYQ